MTLITCESIDAESLGCLSNISFCICSDATAMWREADGRADALEMSRVHLVNSVAPLQAGARVLRGLGAARDAPLLTSGCRRASDLLVVSASTMLHAISSGRNQSAGATLTWGDSRTALVELNDPSTLNAMTEGLLRTLAEMLSRAFASRTV